MCRSIDNKYFRYEYIALLKQCSDNRGYGQKFVDSGGPDAYVWGQSQDNNLVLLACWSKIEGRRGEIDSGKEGRVANCAFIYASHLRQHGLRKQYSGRKYIPRWYCVLPRQSVQFASRKHLLSVFLQPAAVADVKWGICYQSFTEIVNL